MTIDSYNQFTDGGYEGQLSRAEASNKRTYLNPHITQQSTVTVTTGDATTGWTTTVTRTATLETVVVTYDPVDALGVASAVAADAAAALHRAWLNGQADTAFFAQATLAGAVVTFDFVDSLAYTVVTVPAGAGAATDAITVVGGGIKAFVGRWQFFDSTAALAAGDRPQIVTADSQVTLRNIAGIALRSNSIEQPSDDEPNDFFPEGRDVACVEFGVVRVIATVAVTVSDDVHIITAAGVSLGRTAIAGGLNITAIAKFRHDAGIGELVEIAYDLRNVA